MNLLVRSVVVVTGAGRGIGRGIVESLVREGASIIAVSRTHADLESLVTELRPLGQPIMTLVGDVRDRELGVRIIREGSMEFGAVNGLVNNAGVIHFAPVWDQELQHYEEVISTNLTGPFLLAQSFVDYWLREQISGSIVNIGSVESEVPFPNQAPYAATKGGLLGLTRSMAVELASTGIRINQVDPGAIDTPMTGPYREQSIRTIPMGRLGEPAEVGDCVAFLLSDKAGYVTGERLTVDGGYVLQ